MDHLLSAARIIRTECEKHNECELCPFTLRSGECGVTAKNPEAWDIRGDDVINPRVFKYGC